MLEGWSSSPPGQDVHTDIDELLTARVRGLGYLGHSLLGDVVHCIARERNELLRHPKTPRPKAARPLTGRVTTSTNGMHAIRYIPAEDLRRPPEPEPLSVRRLMPSSRDSDIARGYGTLHGNARLSAGARGEIAEYALGGASVHDRPTRRSARAARSCEVGVSRALGGGGTCQ